MVVFQDRVPRYPGRVTMTPVSGQANTYDLARADEPAVEGTKINAALFESLTNELEALINERAKIEVGSYVGTGYYGETYPNSLTFDSVVVAVILVNRRSSSGAYFSMEPSSTSNMNTSFNHIMLAGLLPVDAWSEARVGFTYGASTGGRAKKSADGKTVYWCGGGISGNSDSTSAIQQCNQSGTTYNYIAILE